MSNSSHNSSKMVTSSSTNPMASKMDKMDIENGSSGDEDSKRPYSIRDSEGRLVQADEHLIRDPNARTAVEYGIMIFGALWIIAVLIINNVLGAVYTNLDYTMIAIMVSYTIFTYHLNHQLEVKVKLRRLHFHKNFINTAIYLVLSMFATVMLNYGCGNYLIAFLFRLPFTCMILVTHHVQYSNHRTIITETEHASGRHVVGSPTTEDGKVRGMQITQTHVLDTKKLRVIKNCLRRILVLDVIVLVALYGALYVGKGMIKDDVPVVIYISLMYLLSMIASTYTIGRFNKIIDIAEYSSTYKLRLKIKLGVWAPNNELFLSVCVGFMYLIFISVVDSIAAGNVGC